ncbi:MAG: hypothetical protein IJ609_04940 [Paludibacteraceae bacterium]|nr:hypothetical protein [Paludibacteraceae bacterium]
MPARPVSFSRLTVVLLWSAWLLCACSPVAVQQAQHALAVADSLPPEALTAADSTALASAVTTLRHRRFSFPDDYARACYRYGRLLRLRGDYPAAMQAFIGATRAPYLIRPIPLPGFTDYASLARAYSNMGTMSHLTGNYALSYDMYACSAERFRLAGDSSLFFYVLNAMAQEQAEQMHFSEAYTLLDSIRRRCTDTDVLTKTLEIQSRLCLLAQQYDSAIAYVDELYRRGYAATTGYVIKAQSYWYLNRYDSAVRYAEQVMQHPYATPQERHNMLYILTYNDTTIDKDEIKRRYEEREDIDRYEIDPMLIQLSQATMLLEQDLENSSDSRLLLLLVILLPGVLCYPLIAIRRHKKRMELQIAIDAHNEELRNETTQLEQTYSAYQQHLVDQIEQNCEAFRHSHNWEEDLCWKDYDQMCHVVNQHFFLLANKLKATNRLGERDIRLCVLVLLDLPYEEIARILNLSPKSISKLKSVTARKLNVNIRDLREKLLEIASRTTID